jgi:hypothetical protein
MIAVPMVMSNMDLSHNKLDLVGLDLPGMSLVGLVHSMQQVQSLYAWFGYRWDSYECWSVFGFRCDSCELEPLDYRG